MQNMQCGQTSATSDKKA